MRNPSLLLVHIFLIIAVANSYAQIEIDWEYEYLESTWYGRMALDLTDDGGIIICANRILEKIYDPVYILKTDIVLIYIGVHLVIFCGKKIWILGIVTLEWI